MKLHVLAIVAHCRDAFDMIGGTLANHIDKGDKVAVAVISKENYSDAFRLFDKAKSGAKITKKMLTEESKLHRAMVKKACGFLGIKDIYFVPQKSVLIKFDNSVAERVGNIILEVRPHILITHHPLENAGIGDHTAAGKAAMDALSLAASSRRGTTPHSCTQVFFMCPAGMTTRIDYETVNRYPAIQIDVTKQVEKKLNALSSIQTQYMTRRQSAKELETLTGQAGYHSRISYMEAFQNYLPEIHECLPVPERNIALSQSTVKELFSRIKLITPYLPGVQGKSCPKKQERNKNAF